jgi:SAM-dependent methyltransferase
VGVQNSPPVEDYDAIAYPGYPFPQTHPGRLAALAALHGMRPKPPPQARVLELGCGDGANLVPMALGLPEARFVGVDLNAAAIERGRELAAALQLGNVELHAGDLTDWQPDGEFDYVVAHGVYSWVPPQVRDALLELVANCLADDGVAYVSYNANPGDHLRQIARELMLNAARGIEDPQAQLSAAIDAVHTAIEIQHEGDLYGALLAEYLHKLLDRDPAQVFHDDLATWCEPVQFHELIAHAGHHGLAYLTEADYHETIHGNHRPELLQALRGDELAREQQIDFLRLRMYRQTLLTKAGTKRELTPQALDGLRASSRLRPQDGANLDDTSEVEFSRQGAVVTTGHPVVKRLLGALAVAWPASVAIEDLLGDDPPAVREALMAGFASDLVELTAHDARIATSAKGDVRVSPLARLQAQAKCPDVTNLRHERIDITLEDRDLIAGGSPAARLARMAVLVRVA